MRFGRWTVAVTCCAAALCSTGCVMPDQVSKMQKDLADVQEQLRRIERDQSQTRDMLERLETQASRQEGQVTRAEVADLAFRLDQVARESEITDERLGDLDRQIERMAEEVRQSREMAQGASGATTDVMLIPGVVGSAQGTAADPRFPAEQPGQAEPDPGNLYNTAYTDFSKGNYALAVAGFEEFVEKYEDNPLADNAMYWVGECHFSQGGFDEAIQAFDRMLEQFPDSDKAAAANLKKGLAYLEQNEIRQAIVQLQHVRSAYPGSDEARIARDKLTSLGAPI